MTLLFDQRLRERQPQRKKGTTNLNRLSQQILLLPQSPKRKERVPKARKEKGKVKVKEKGKQEIQRIRMGSQRRQEEVKARTPKVKVRATGRHNPRKPPFHVCFSQKGPVTGVRTVLSHMRFPMQRLLRQRRKVHPLQQRAQLQQSP